AARADNAATGVWIDHTGRGAVEITECNGKLCGHVAWVEDAKNAGECGKQIIGNVKSVGKNKWDNGWIYDPDRGSKYDVELTATGADKLKVVGYAGTKWLSETYTWKRAPADLQKCNGDTAAVPAAAAGDKPAVAAKKDEDKPAVTKADEPIKLDEAKSDTDKSEPVKSKPETAKADAEPEKAAPTETATADDEDTSDEPKGRKKNAGKVLARIMDELGDGDGPVKIKRSGKTCKVDAPFVGVVSFPCDKD
ncbi:MAG: DUF2147 domain-containing protein, partial [Hyphomicrobium sp.]|nr:DUF2147 domain-containing protein [Hyphomicrobium sp.]